MTVFVASIYLPYTVHFEVESNPNNQSNNELSDVAIPIKSGGVRKQQTGRQSISEPKSGSSYGESIDGNLSTSPNSNGTATSDANKSIPVPIKSNQLSNPVNSSSKPSSKMNIDKPVSIIAQMSNGSKSSPIKLEEDTDSMGKTAHAEKYNVNSDPSSGYSISSPDNGIDISSGGVIHDKLIKSASTGTYSAQDFFYNNPNGSFSKRQLTNYLPEDADSFDDGKILRSQSALNLVSYDKANPNAGAGAQANNPNNSTSSLSSTFVQPRLVVNRANSFNISVSEKKRIPSTHTLEPSLSSLKVNRASALRRPTMGNSFADLPKLATNEANASSSSSSTSTKLERDLQKDDSDSALVDDTEFHEKVTPYGGFSKPSRLLLNQNNIFATAPWKVVSLNKGNGSLKNAVKLAEDEGIIEDEVQWIGSLGMPTDLVPDSTKEKISEELETKFNSNPIFISDELFDGHYNSFCKQILWPTFHYQIPDDPKSNAFEIHSWEDYKQVNQFFADKIIAKYKEGDVVWVHDYHLLLLPEMIRKELPNAKIGFFLHISFPSSEVFRCFAQRRGLLNGMLGADVICFQTQEYVRHFFQTCNRLLLADFDEKGVMYKGRSIQVSHIPIGIDEESLMENLNDEDVLHWRQLIKEKWGDKTLLVSRDKIDRIRGVKEKLLAYECFLKSNPEYLDKTILILICLKGKNDIDDDLEIEIFKIVGRINSMTTNIAIDKPVVYLNQEMEFSQYLALLSESSTFIVSTLREGMNLTSHEFIIASHESYSPLILSEFTGSAQVIKRGPLLINPYNIRQSAQAIKDSIEMPFAEKKERWEQMHEIISSHDSKSWVRNNMNAIQCAWENENKFKANATQLLTQLEFNKRYCQVTNKKRLIILNIGNLASNLNYQGATINPVQQQFILSTLNELSRDANNIVYIISYTKRIDLLRKYKRLGEIGLIAENGGYIKEPNSNRWLSLINEKTELKWIEPVKSVMNAMMERLSGSYIEIEDCTLRFHTEKCIDIDKDHKATLVGELISHVNDLYSKDNIHATLLDGIVMVQESNLAIRPLTYILNCVSRYEITKFEGSIKVMPSTSINSTPISQPEKEIYPGLDGSVTDSSLYKDEDDLSFMMYAGGSTPIDEEIFNFCEEIKGKGLIDDVLTVKVGNLNGEGMMNSSSAHEKLEGINELLQILSNAK